MTKTQAIRKSNFEKTLGTTEKDFMLYCLTQCYYSETITDRKLKNRFSEELITKAKTSGIIVPWKDGYFFKAYDFCKEQFDLKKLIDEANTNYNIGDNK